MDRRLSTIDYPMNFPFLVARRYFRSKNTKNFIQVISNISMVGVAVGSMALVVVLSVFNGLEELIRASYNTFDPELKILPARGKTFALTDSLRNQLKALPGVAIVTEVIEDNALARYQDASKVVTIKGVSDNFVEQNRLDRAMIYGDVVLKDEQRSYAILGQGVQYDLSIAPSNDFYALQVFSPRRGSSRSTGFSPNPMASYVKRKNIMPGGVFAIEKQFDANYVIVPLSFAQDLFEYDNERTALEIKSQPDANPRTVQQQIQGVLGDGFLVLNSDEQHASLLRAIRFEKLFAYITFCFILAVASFNIFFSLSMLAIDKRKDVAMLYALGATRRTVRQIFWWEGIIIALIGTVTGLTVGFLICWVQQTFGVVSMGMQTAIIDAYPVKMELSDFLYTALSISVIALLATYRPAVIAARTHVKDFL